MASNKLAPPPSVVDLVTNEYDDDKVIDKKKQDSNWKKWLNGLYIFLSVDFWRLVSDTGEPSFEGAWANVGGGDAVAAFYKDSFDRVYVKGHVDSGVSGTVVFTFPEKYRQDETLEFTCHTTSGSGGSSGHSYAVITSDGKLTLYMSGTSTDVSLDNILFRLKL